VSSARKIFHLPAAFCLAAVLILSACGPKSEEDYFNRATALFEKGRFQEAVLTYQHYLVDFPDGKMRDLALFRSGEILYYALEQRGPALRDFSLLIQKHPYSKYALQAREILAGFFQDERHDYQRAVLEYEWLLKERPRHPKADEFQFQIARCYMQAGQTERAVRELKYFVERYPDSELVERAYDELGSAYMILGWTDQALQVFRRSISLFPESPLRPTIEFKMGNCLEEMQRYKEALAVYQGVLDRYENRAAVELRIEGLKNRRSQKLAEAPPVDYGYRPKPKRKDDSKKKTTKSNKNEKKTPVKVEGLNYQTKDGQGG